ncbi:hypothetical protein LguiA_022969 [Lonicera macranthoides]
MVLTRNKRRLLDLQPASPTLEITDETISVDNFSLAKRAKANPTASVFKKKGLHGYKKLFKIFKNTTVTGVFGQASNQGPLDSDEDMDVGGGLTMF